MSDLMNYFERVPAEDIKQYATTGDMLAAYAASKAAPDATVQRALAAIGRAHEKYPDNTLRAYKTFRNHGYQGKVLALPDVTSFDELFCHVKLEPTSDTNQMTRERAVSTRGEGYVFVNSNSRDRSMYKGDDSVPYFGYVGETHIVEDKRRPGEMFCFGRCRGEFYASYARPTDALRDTLLYGTETPQSTPDERDRQFSRHYTSFEFVYRRETNAPDTCLVVARREFGTEWVTILDADDTRIKIARATRRGSPVAMEAWTKSQLRLSLAHGCVDPDTNMIDKAKAEANKIEVRKSS